MIEAVRGVVERAAAAGVAAACFSATPEGARRWLDLGVRMVMVGVDTQILLPALRGVAAASRPQP